MATPPRDICTQQPSTWATRELLGLEPRRGVIPGKKVEATETTREVPHKYSSPACFMHELDPEWIAAGETGIRIKRIYDEPTPTDGYRVLVDRFWPRGIRKQDVALDDWVREIAPSSALRKWFGHDPVRWTKFRQKYRVELRAQEPQLDAIRRRALRGRVTLLYAASNRQFNQAVVLEELLQPAKRDW